MVHCGSISRFSLSLPSLSLCRYALKTKNVEKRGGLAVIIVDLATSPHGRPLIMPQFWRELGSCVGGSEAADPYTADTTGKACKDAGGALSWVSFFA